ncbi:hypothetical protein ART_3420 [Arthrobacter sp. PAMC 25486]|nr:hypothetical protein ART_3420 [Arthrobacter sp. PAMC 25486]
MRGERLARRPNYFRQNRHNPGDLERFLPDVPAADGITSNSSAKLAVLIV